MTTPLWTIMVVTMGSFIGGFGALFLKKGSANLHRELLKNFFLILKNKYLIMGILCYGIGTFIFIPALKFGELSVLYPFVATVYIWTTLFSIKFLNENMNKWKYLGILFIIIGVSLIGIA